MGTHYPNRSGRDADSRRRGQDKSKQVVAKRYDPTPSMQFDWGTALLGFKGILDQVYGPGWRDDEMFPIERIDNGDDTV